MSALVIFSVSLLVIQVLYLSIFLIAFSRKETGETDTKPPNPVSVIVCAHDEEKNLKELIPLLLKQEHPEFEIIIVEDRSNDGSYDYLLKETQQNSRLRMVRVVNKPEYINGKKYGITLGIRAAKHNWLLFTDADCRPYDQHWITRMTERYNDHTEIIIGFSPYRKEKGLLNAFIRFESIITGIQAIGMALLGKPYMGVGRNLAYTRKLFFESKGFNDYLGVVGGDDDLFVNRNANGHNTQLCLGLESTTISKPKTSWRDFFNQKLRHLNAGKHYKLSDKFILGTFVATWLLSWLLAVPALVVTQWYWLLLIVFIIRWILLIWLIERASKRLGCSFEWWKTPFLDFIFVIYYLVTGLRALVVKKIRWKN